jgi:hypothetical protein
VTTHAPLRSQRTKAVSAYHVRVTGHQDSLPSPRKDTRLGLGLECADQGSDVARPGADGAQQDDLGTPLFRGIGHGDGLLGPIQTDVKRVRVTQG